MLTYSFDNTGSDSLYEHLYKCIKNDILSGELAPDYKLPSKRSFAKNLGISTITVENERYHLCSCRLGRRLFYCHFWRLGLCSGDTSRLYGNRLFHRHHHCHDEKVQTHRKRRTFFQSWLVRSGEKSLHFNADRRCSSDGYSAEYQLHPRRCLHQLLPERTAFHCGKYKFNGDPVSACNPKSN